MRHLARLALLLPLAACAGPGATDDGIELAVSARTPAPDAASLALTTMDGRPLDLNAELAGGRSVVLVFWQTWCASCLAEAPELVEAANAHADDIAFVGVVPGPDRAVDDAEVRAVAERFAMPYPQVRDREDALVDAFDVRGTPTLVGLRPDGSVGWTSHRPADDWAALHRALRGE